MSACWVCGAPSLPDPAYGSTGYWRCPSCRLLFDPARGSADAEAQRYDEGYFADYPGGQAYEADDQQRRFEASRRLRFVGAHAPARGRLLEIGAAAGHFLRAAADAGYEASGIEPAAAVAARGAARLGVDLRGATLEELPSDGPGHDVVCAWQVLEHLPEPRASIGKLRSLLAPGGVLLLEVPNVASVAARAGGEAWFHLDPDNHVALYTPEALRRLLAAEGLGVRQLDTVSPLTFLRPRLALHPRGLAAWAKQARAVRAAPWRALPDRHEFLRVAAQRA